MKISVYFITRAVFKPPCVIIFGDHAQWRKPVIEDTHPRLIIIIVRRYIPNYNIFKYRRNSLAEILGIYKVRIKISRVEGWQCDNMLDRYSVPREKNS